MSTDRSSMPPKAQSRPWRRLRNIAAFFQGNLSASIGGGLMALVIVACLIGPWFTAHAPDERVARPHVEPNAEHLLGTTRQGRDVFSQLLHGGRASLSVAFIAGAISTVISILVGISAGYFGGRIDQWLNFAMNVVLVFPQLPLLIVLAAFLGQVGPVVIALLIGITSWPWGARVVRSQTMAIRQKEFILSAECMGENRLRIVLVEILPNLISIVAGSFVGVVMYALINEAGLEFLGLGDPTIVTWGTMLYWAQSSAALYTGGWWEMIVPAVTIALVGGAMALINMSIDQVSNPKLKTGPHIKRWRKLNRLIQAKRQGGTS
ncbi:MULTISPECIES: ABC transporter permease [Halomonadaceae]|uniref:ABC transporter permease n=1 Tax=Halomonadaceae TaxID=28256 RepID=UPI0020C73506|nr:MULTISPECIES: ABC transporter permease [Halomonas]MDI4636364.1 ABC transporter permease [Halomonas sp. BMC7]|tara:strand:+ start:6576 stop:7538 length:963 start_codon:yes stop_codon:yes gene_type:complete